MTHSPPIPAGNQSPYPIQEPPHVDRATREKPAATPSRPPISLGTALAIGTGAVIAGAAAFLFLRDTKPKKKPAVRKRRKS